MRLVEDNPSSLSLVEIYKQRCAKKGIEHDNPISRYYDRLATVQARGTQASHQVRGLGWPWAQPRATRSNGTEVRFHSALQRLRVLPEEQLRDENFKGTAWQVHLVDSPGVGG